MNDYSPETFENKNLPFTVNRLSPTIGGEILGIDLSQPIDSETKALVYEALLVYKVIFFRDQNISTEQHLNFSKNFVLFLSDINLLNKITFDSILIENK